MGAGHSPRVEADSQRCHSSSSPVGPRPPTLGPAVVSTGPRRLQHSNPALQVAHTLGSSCSGFHSPRQQPRCSARASVAWRANLQPTSSRPLRPAWHRLPTPRLVRGAFRVLARPGEARGSARRAGRDVQGQPTTSTGQPVPAGAQNGHPQRINPPEGGLKVWRLADSNC